METTAPRTVWTEEKISSLPKDGHRYELIDGELVMSAAGVEHGYVAILIAAALGSYVRSHKLGIVCDSSTGFWMKKGNFRSPDVSFIAKERLQGLKRPSKKFFQGSPDLAIEVLSPSDTIEGIHERIVEYFENDTQLVWIVNLEEEIVLVYCSPQPEKLLRAGNSLDGEAVVPGFVWPLAELFAELEF